jgi:hypothetical protein
MLVWRTNRNLPETSARKLLRLRQEETLLQLPGVVFEQPCLNSIWG